MSKRWILAGSTDQTIDVFIQDSTSSVGEGLSGLAFNTPGLRCYYRKGATGMATQLPLASQTVNGAHVDGGFVQIDATNMKGVYRLDLSDAVVDTAGMATIFLYGAANMSPVAAEIEVVSVNVYDSVRMGLTSLPNASAGSNGGLPLGDANARVDVGRWLGSSPNVLQSGRVDAYGGALGPDVITSSSIAADAIGSSELASSAITEIQSGLSTLDASGVRAAIGLSSANLDNQLDTIKGYIDTEVLAIKSKTDNLPNAFPANFSLLSINSNGEVVTTFAIRKNVSLPNYQFLMVDSTDHITGKSGLTVTAQRVIDGGPVGLCANTVTEIGGGLYRINLAASDLNGNVITLIFSAPGADTSYATVITQS